MTAETLVDLIRHGEPEGGPRYRGNGTDDPLSALGWAQMRQALGDQNPWDEILTSPLRRCRAFAEYLAERHARPLTVESELREVGLGAWEGQTPAEVRARDPQGYAAFYRDPLHRRPPGAEPLEAFVDRVGGAYDALVARRPGAHLLLVVHAGVIRALAGRVLSAAPAGWYRLGIGYAGLMRIRHQEFGPVLEWINARRLPEPGSEAG